MAFDSLSGTSTHILSLGPHRRLGEGQEGTKITGILVMQLRTTRFRWHQDNKKGSTGKSPLHCLQCSSHHYSFSFPCDSSGRSAICPSLWPLYEGSDLNIFRSYTCPDFLSSSPHHPLSDVNPSNHIKTQNRPCLLLFKGLSWFPITYNKMPWTEVPRNQKNVRAK